MDKTASKLVKKDFFFSPSCQVKHSLWGLIWEYINFDKNNLYFLIPPISPQGFLPIEFI